MIQAKIKFIFNNKKKLYERFIEVNQDDKSKLFKYNYKINNDFVNINNLIKAKYKKTFIDKKTIANQSIYYFI